MDHGVANARLKQAKTALDGAIPDRARVKRQ
jgi:hypothetical protein